MELNIQTMLYKTENINGNLRILGEYFCRNNKNKGKLIINNKKTSLKEFIEITNIKEKRIKIKMIINKNLYAKNHMFNNCNSLLELTVSNNLEDMENFDNSEINNFKFEKNEFDNKLEKGGEIIYENESNNESIELIEDYFEIDKDIDIFQEKNNNYLSEIKRDTKENEEDSSLIDFMKLFESQYNYSNLKYLFYKCSSLSSLPDISKWNTNNVTDMSSMFYDCYSLLNHYIKRLNL